MFVVMLAVYIVTSAVKARLDVTDRAHTLSPGTKKILAKLDSRVSVRFYCTQGDNAMPSALRRTPGASRTCSRVPTGDPKAN